MAFSFVSTDVVWELSGDACEESAAALGVDSVETFMQAFSWGFGFGPLDPSSDFYDTLTAAVEEPIWTDDWDGRVSMGYLYTDVTGTPSFSATDFVFTYGLDDGTLVAGTEHLDGAGDASTPMDGYYRAQGFYGYTIGATR